jgi:hypothetical protein
MKNKKAHLLHNVIASQLHVDQGIIILDLKFILQEIYCYSVKMSQEGQAEGAGWVLGQTRREAQDLPSSREKWSRCSMDRHLLHSLPKTMSHSAKDRVPILYQFDQFECHMEWLPCLVCNLSNVTVSQGICLSGCSKSLSQK